MGNNKDEFMWCFNMYFIQIISFSIHHLCIKTYLTTAYITYHTTTVTGAIVTVLAENIQNFFLYRM